MYKVEKNPYPVFRVVKSSDSEEIEEQYVVYNPKSKKFICTCKMFPYRLTCEHVQAVKAYLLKLYLKV